MTCSCVDESLYDPRDVLHVQRDLWYCSKFVKHTRGNEVTAYERMVSGEPSEAESPLSRVADSHVNEVVVLHAVTITAGASHRTLLWCVHDSRVHC